MCDATFDRTYTLTALHDRVIVRARTCSKRTRTTGDARALRVRVSRFERCEITQVKLKSWLRTKAVASSARQFFAASYARTYAGFFFLFDLSLVREEGTEVERPHGATRTTTNKTQPRTVDHLARGSMKTAANCASSCNPQVMRTSTSRTHIAALVTKESWATPV